MARGAEVNEPGKNELTLLMLAVQKDNLDSTRFFLNAKADVNASRPDGKQTALTLACSNNNADIMNLLFAAGAYVNAVTTKSALSLLFTFLSYPFFAPI